jgi:spore coat protein CotH
MPSLKVKFDHFVGGQQLNGMDRLTLNNNKQDPAHVKQCLAYGLMRDAGVPAPRCNFSHLTVTVVNGQNETTAVDRIYTNVESIKDPFLRRNFGSDQDQGRLYEGTLSDFWTGSFRNTIEPKTAAAAADTSEIDALTTALMAPGLSDAARLAAISGLVDVDDYLTFWAAEGMVGHWDGYADDQNNFWFYVDPADALMRFIPWGTDDTLGRGNPLRGGDATHAEAIVPRSALPRRLYEISVSNAQFIAKLQTLMDTVFVEAELHAEIDRIEALITPISGDLTAPLTPIRTWIDAHRAAVTAEIASPPPGFGAQPNHFCVLNP